MFSFGILLFYGEKKIISNLSQMLSTNKVLGATKDPVLTAGDLQLITRMNISTSFNKARYLMAEDLQEKSLGLLSEPSDVKQQNDPLTPLDQKFATLDDLQKHYNTFLTRIQQQLSTLGGGGEYRFRFLDGLEIGRAHV